jgi:hypothetical protein
VISAEVWWQAPGAAQQKWQARHYLKFLTFEYSSNAATAQQLKSPLDQYCIPDWSVLAQL